MFIFSDDILTSHNDNVYILLEDALSKKFVCRADWEPRLATYPTSCNGKWYRKETKIEGSLFGAAVFVTFDINFSFKLFFISGVSQVVAV